MSSKTQIPKKEMSELGGAVFVFVGWVVFKEDEDLQFPEAFVLSPTIMEVKNGRFGHLGQAFPQSMTQYDSMILNYHHCQWPSLGDNSPTVQQKCFERFILSNVTSG